jgi:hypothetical protein
MEGLVASGGVIAVVSLAAQVLQGCNYLRSVFDNANGAPKEIHLLIAELAVIEAIVRAVPDDGGHRDALDFCNEAISKLRKLVDKYGVVDGVAQSRKWGLRLGMALNMEKIQKHLVRLREARGHLGHIQNL